MTEALKTIGVACGIAGALIVALNLSWSGWGFVVFLVSSLSLLWAAARMREWKLELLFVAYTIVNVIGIWRWLFLPS